MIALAWIAGTALAGTVYINGVRADVLPEMTLENVSVRIDAMGNLYIDAPGYRARVVSAGDPAYAAPVAAPPAAYAAPPATPVAAPPAAYAPPPVAAAPPAAPVYGATAPVPPATPAAAPTAPAVATGAYWLVTEDNDSVGHEVEVLVNGTLVRRIRSGEPQLILDLAPWLKPGANSVVLQATATGRLDGGVLNVYIGRGSNAGGTIRMDEPEVRYSRRATDAPGGASRPYTLNVP